MTEVCILGADDADIRFDVMTYENARRALSAYELREPFENSLAVETGSLGMAVSLLGDLDWYLARLADAALVREPSVDDEEWLSRDLARAVRDGEVEPADTGDLLKLYGVEYDDGGDGSGSDFDESGGDAGVGDDASAADGDGGDARSATRSSRRQGRLVEPMYVRRVDGHVPEYDLRDVEETVVVRVTESEFR